MWRHSILSRMIILISTLSPTSWQWITITSMASTTNTLINSIPAMWPDKSSKIKNSESRPIRKCKTMFLIKSLLGLFRPERIIRLSSRAANTTNKDNRSWTTKTKLEMARIRQTRCLWTTGKTTKIAMIFIISREIGIWTQIRRILKASQIWRSSVSLKVGNKRPRIGCPSRIAMSVKLFRLLRPNRCSRYLRRSAWGTAIRPLLSTITSTI